MLLLERRILRGFLVRLAAILASLVAVSSLVFMRRLARKGLSGWNKIILLDVFADLALSLEAALVVAAPLAMLLTLLRLKQTGILTVCFGVGLHPSRLRRCLLLAGMTTVLLSALGAQATAWASSGRDGELTIWRTNGRYVWCPPGRDRGGLLFDDDSIDVQRVSAVRARSFGVPLPQMPRGTATLFPLPVISAWVSGAAGPATMLAALNRLCFAAIMMLACAYVGLLLPIQRQWLAFLALPCLLPVVGIVGILVAILLWERDWHGYVAEGAFVFALAALIVTFDRLFQKRGLRLSS